MDVKHRSMVLWAALAAVATAACRESPDLTLPEVAEVEAHYDIGADHEADMSGNVAELVVEQSARDLRRGGSMWARVGPYIYLFSDGTQQLFNDFPGLAAVRVITRTSDGREVARATLLRDALNGLTWKRALNIAGHARAEGTLHVRRIEELIRWGEDHTEFQYSAAFVH